MIGRAQNCVFFEQPVDYLVQRFLKGGKVSKVVTRRLRLGNLLDTCVNIFAYITQFKPLKRNRFLGKLCLTD
jgi:hypothetical protein